jgi:DNA repair exonuclease SbcCD ATPase subunit
MDITNIKINNFLIIGQADIDLCNRGLCRIAGENSDDVTSSSNGAGKSTVVEAVYWALFGETLRNIKSADGVVNRKIKKNCSVVLRFEEGDTKYRIERYRKHTKNKNNLYLYINDVDSRGKDNRETQTYIESVIGMDKMSFANSVIFGQGHSKNLKRFSEMTDSEKKETLENILNLEVFVKSYDFVKDNLRTLEATRHESARRARELSERVIACEEKVAHAIQRAEEFEREKSVEVAELKTKKESITETVMSLEERITSLAPDDTKDLEESIADCEEFLSAEKDRKRSVAEVYMEKRNEQLLIVGGIERDMAVLQKKLDMLAGEDQIGKECDYCGNQITSKDLELSRDGHEFNIDDMKRSVKTLSKKAEDVTSAYKNKVLEIEENIGEVSSLIKSYKERLKTATDIKNKRLELTFQLKAKEELMSSYQQTIERIESLENAWKQTVEEYGKELDILSEGVKGLEEEVDTLDIDISYYEFWKNAFSRTGIRSYLLDRIVPFLNERVGHYLNILTDGCIEAEFSTIKELASGEKRENFNLEISNRNAAGSYEGNSGGEKRRIDLGVALGFNDFIASRSGKRFNLLVLDEVFEGVDAEGLYYVIKVLEDIARRKSSVFVITHRDELKSYFSDEILLNRKDGLSYVQE